MPNKQVLLVEDNPDDLELTLLALRENRLANEIVCVRDGREALNWLWGESEYSSRNAGEQPAVVLLDLKLPKLNGLEVLTRMRSDNRTQLTPVVMLTSSREQEDIAHAYSSGVNSFIQKPVEFTSFCTAVRNLGMYWTILNQPVPNLEVPA